MPPGKCKDCPQPARRPAPYPGPRCATHWRAEVRRRKMSAAEKRDLIVYGVAPEDRVKIMALQGGRCAVCRQATGATRRLAIDHDHHLVALGWTVRDTVRGLLCSRCNVLIGLLGDDPTAFERVADYLRYRPAQQVLQIYPPENPP